MYLFWCKKRIYIILYWPIAMYIYYLPTVAIITPSIAISLLSLWTRPTIHIIILLSKANTLANTWRGRYPFRARTETTPLRGIRLQVSILVAFTETLTLCLIAFKDQKLIKMVW